MSLIFFKSSDESESAAYLFCQGYRRDGKPCLNYPSKGKDPRFCHHHQFQSEHHQEDTLCNPPRCLGLRKDGQRCQNHPSRSGDTSLCYLHQDQGNEVYSPPEESPPKTHCQALVKEGRACKNYPIKQSEVFATTCGQSQTPNFVKQGDVRFCHAHQ